MSDEAVGNGQKVPRKRRSVAVESVSSGFSGESVAENGESVKKLNVLPSMSTETVLDLDSKGVELYFGSKEDFLVLDETTIRALSRENRNRYSTARQFHDNWRGQQDADFVDAFQVDREFVGTASDKLNDLTVRSGLQHRWVRPDRVAEMQGRGYRLVSADEAKSFLGSKKNRHEISHNGRTELVLMGVSKEIFEKRQKDKVEKNNSRATAWKTSGVEQLASNGSRAFVEGSASDRKANFSEIPEE
jgi:hypothetical protein